MQCFCEFSKESVLKVFLCYLTGQDLPGLAGKGENEESVGQVIDCFNDFKKYYTANWKDVEANAEREDYPTEALSQKYLFIREVKEVYNNSVKI
jgi:hypothetical protein